MSQAPAERFVVARNETRDSILAHRTGVARTSATRRKGLLGRSSLPEGEALWIVPCESVHTWFMKFPVDVVYLDKKNRVRKIRRAMAPWRMSLCVTAHSVLELPAGTAEKTNTQRGDQLTLSPGK